jgi:thiol reductant ABC exporter CydC subunit
MMFIAYLLGALAFIGGIGLTVSSGWLITMASSHPPILTLGVAIVLVRFFGISRSVARYGERLISHKAVFDRLANIRVQLYSKLVGNSIALSSFVNSGSAVKTLVDDVERAQEYQLRIKLPGASAVLSLTAGALLGWWVRPESLLITIPVSIILLVVFPRLISRLNVPIARSIEAQENKYSQIVQASVHGIIEAQIYGYMEQSQIPAKVAEDEIVTSEKKLILKSAYFALMANGVIATSVVGSVWLAEKIMSNNPIPAVQVAMLIFLPLVMFEAITAWYPNLFNSGKLLASQIAVDSMLNLEDVGASEIKLNEQIQGLRCKDTQVSWGSDFMQPVNFEITRGELLVIRGNSGAGKSTLIMGLLGQLPYTGSIQINGIELSEFTELNQQIVGTIQRSHIFNTSIRENLKIANPQVSDEEIFTILRMLDLDSVVNQMSNGLDTIIGEFGRALSGGEAKRLSIARALLSNSDVYIFDEPTEHLDLELATRIETSVTEFLKEKIVIVVTHNGWNHATKTLNLVR